MNYSATTFSTPVNSLLRASETVCFQNEAGSIFYNSAGYVRLAWSSDRITLESIQAFYEQTLSLLLRTGSQRILTEHGQRKPLSVAAQQWLTTNWLPRAVQEARLSRTAIVEGADPLHRLSTQAVVSAAPAEVVFKRFHTVSSAETWLLE